MDSILIKLNKIRRTSKGWIAACPNHDDDDPSLSISHGRNGRILMNCFAGCSTSDVLDSMGLQFQDLFLR